MNKLTVDGCPDSEGFWTIRDWDGTDCGDTDTCHGTIYDYVLAAKMVEAYNEHYLFDEGMID